MEAVIQAHGQDVQTLLAQCDRLPDPRQRLFALLTAEREGKPLFVRFGCPYGSLSQELNTEQAKRKRDTTVRAGFSLKMLLLTASFNGVLVASLKPCLGRVRLFSLHKQRDPSRCAETECCLRCL